MMRLKTMGSILALALSATSAFAEHALRYRLTPIAGQDDASVSAADTNERSQVLGQLGGGDGSCGFVWERGHVTVLPLLREDQTSNFVADINNRDSVVGGMSSHDAHRDVRAERLSWCPSPASPSARRLPSAVS